MFFSLEWKTRLGASRLELASELAAFDRNVGDEGWRLDLMPRLSRTFAGAAWLLEPAVSIPVSFDYGGICAPCIPCRPCVPEPRPTS